MKRNPTRPDLLSRFDSLVARGLVASGRKFELEHKLARNCIAKFRQGHSHGPASKPTVDAFEAAILQVEAADARARLHGAQEAAPAPEHFQPSPPPPSVSMNAPGARAPGRPRARVEEDVLQALLPRIKAADTTPKKDELLRYVMELAAKSEISGELARFFNDSIGQQRQLAKVTSEDEERSRAGEPVKVEIVYVNDWRGAKDSKE